MYHVSTGESTDNSDSAPLDFDKRRCGFADSLNLDYSLMHILPLPKDMHGLLQFGRVFPATTASQWIQLTPPDGINTLSRGKCSPLPVKKVSVVGFRFS